MKQELSSKQKRLIEEIGKDISSNRKPRSKHDLLIAAGYSKSSARQPNKIFKSPYVQSAMDGVSARIESLMGTSLLHITDDKLREMPADKISRVLKDLHFVMERLDSFRRSEEQPLSIILDF